MDGLRKRRAPHKAVSVGVEVDAAHTWLGSVGSAHESGILWDDLRQMSGTTANVSCESSKVVEAGAQSLSDADAALAGLLVGVLESTEEPGTARYGDGHKPKLTQDALPHLLEHRLNSSEEEK